MLRAVSCTCRCSCTVQNQVRQASTSAANPFPWPSSSNPGPYELLHLPRTATPSQIKRRFFELAKVYHPDKHMHAETSRSVEESEARFAQLKQAFDLLSNDQSRQLFLRSGLGWRGPGGSAGGGFSSDDIPFDVRHNPWGQPRTSTRTRYGHQRGAYPSMHWDWSEADFYTPSYDKQGSDADKPLSNTIMFGMLGFGSLAFYFYNILVSVPENDPAKITASGGSGLKVMEDRHEKARMALVDARQAAKENAAERRLQIRGQAKLFGLDSGTTGHMPPPDMSMPVKQVSGPAVPASKGQPSQAALPPSPPPPPSSPRDRQTSSPVE